MLNTQAADVSLTNGQSSSQTNIFTALLYGLSLLVNVWAFYRISGGLFNPAVSLSIPMRKIKTEQSCRSLLEWY